MRVPTPRGAAAISATTLGFGLFVGIAIGPGLSGVGLASGGPTTLELPAPSASGSDTTSTDASGPQLGGTVSSKPSGPSAPPLPPAPVVTTTTTPATTTTPSTTTAPTTTTPTTPNQPPPHHNPPPGGGDDGALVGTVVHLNPAASSYAVATKTNQLFAVHTKDPLPDTGTVVSAPVKQLSNRTFGEKDSRTVKKKAVTSAKFTGAVTFVDANTGDYAVSSQGATVLVHVPSASAKRSKRGSAKPAAPPAVGDDVLVTVSIDPPADDSAGDASDTPPVVTCPGQEPPPAAKSRARGPVHHRPAKRRAHRMKPRHRKKPAEPQQSILTQASVEVTGQALGELNVEGQVDATCSDPSLLMLSADDVRESQQDLSLSAGDEFDLTKLAVGTPIVATMTAEDDGSLTLDGLASDDGLKGANDPGTAQGDLGP